MGWVINQFQETRNRPDDLRAKRSYIPKIMIERVWNLPDGMQTEFIRSNGIPPIVLDPRLFDHANTMFDSIRKGVQSDLSALCDRSDVPKLSTARTLSYNIVLAREGDDQTLSSRACIIQIENPQSRIHSFSDGSFQIHDKEGMMELIIMCIPWFDRSKSPQQELFSF